MRGQKSDQTRTGEEVQMMSERHPQGLMEGLQNLRNINVRINCLKCRYYRNSHTRYVHYFFTYKWISHIEMLCEDHSITCLAVSDISCHLWMSFSLQNFSFSYQVGVDIYLCSTSGNKLPAHKTVLSAVSPYFRTMWQTGQLMGTEISLPRKTFISLKRQTIFVSAKNICFICLLNISL